MDLRYLRPIVASARNSSLSAAAYERNCANKRIKEAGG